MEKNIKDYLHYYLGQTIKTDGGYLILAAIQTEIIPCTNYRIIVLNGNHVHEAEWDDKCKLVLRKLESMTDEEKKNIGFEAYNVLRDAKKLPAFQEGKIWAAQQTHYLLSKGFDLFGLIDSDLAIEKKMETVSQ